MLLDRYNVHYFKTYVKGYGYVSFYFADNDIIGDTDIFSRKECKFEHSVIVHRPNDVVENRTPMSEVTYNLRKYLSSGCTKLTYLERILNKSLYPESVGPYENINFPRQIVTSTAR